MNAAELGFEYWSYHVRIPFPISDPKTLIADNHPPAWRARYRQKKYHAIDPMLHHARHCQTPLMWSDQVFATAPGLWKEMQANGLRVGWAYPARDGRNLVGLFTVARSEKNLGLEETREKQSHIAWLAQRTHLAISAQITPHYVPAQHAPVSMREVDILRLTAEGKTSSEVAHRLGITERTVNYHTANAAQKLGAANKTAAVAVAALLGLL